MCMSEKYVQVLDQCRVSLVKDLDPDDVMDYLIAERVFVPDDQEKVQSKKTRKERVRQLLELIPRRGNRAFEVFLKALEDRDSGHHHLYDLLVRKLDETEPSGVTVHYDVQQQNAEDDVRSMEPIACTESHPGDNADAGRAYNSLPEQSQKHGYDYAEHMHNEPKSPNMIPSERLLSLLAGKLGQEWEKLASLLGLSAGDVYQCKMENQYNLWAQKYGALVKWRNREYKNATIHALVKELQHCHVPRDNYEFLMNAE